VVPTALELGLRWISTAAEFSAAAQTNFKAVLAGAHAAAHATGTHPAAAAAANASAAVARHDGLAVGARPRTIAVP